MVLLNSVLQNVYENCTVVLPLYTPTVASSVDLYDPTEMQLYRTVIAAYFSTKI